MRDYGVFQVIADRCRAEAEAAERFSLNRGLFIALCAPVPWRVRTLRAMPRWVRRAWLALVEHCLSVARDGLDYVDVSTSAGGGIRVSVAVPFSQARRVRSLYELADEARLLARGQA